MSGCSDAFAVSRLFLQVDKTRGFREVSTPPPSSPTQIFKPKNILKRSIINHRDIIPHSMYNAKLPCIP